MLLVDVADEWIVDIKDMNSAIYKEYTGLDNSKVKLNLYYLAEQVGVDAVRGWVPLIPEFNSEEDVEKSVKELKELGFCNIDVFDYKIFWCASLNSTIKSKVETNGRWCYLIRWIMWYNSNDYRIISLGHL